MAGTFHVINLGCKVNRVEADSMAASLLACGAERSALPNARLILINTCTVTGEADAKSRKAVRRALREAPGAAVIVCGCGATVDPEQFEGLSKDCLVIPNKATALQKAGELLGVELSELCQPGATLRAGEGFNTRAQIKIQDGCDNSCSYCIVPRARGAAQSVDGSQVLQEIQTLVEAGVREIVLTGIDLGSYRGSSIQTLAVLLKQALELASDFRIRLSSIEMPSISDDLLQLITASRGRICAHLHIPLQSGSDTVLGAMRRRYSRADFSNRMAQIKAKVPQIALSTDVIVGFPGETEEDFNDTLTLCSEVGFSRIHAFRYSKRPGTPAATMPRQVPAATVARRAAKLREVADELTRLDALARLGTTEMVLAESAQRGRSESYYPVQLEKGTRRGSLVAMKLVGYEQHQLIAQECEEISWKKRR
ncbi:MAG: tRNA (N(6)-L-threonylcarbamoyladenosine(37)-C(2))-methylthiotransferase MtaB [Coriobacteriales bacterium]|jgi:threonylcarbamoyladenosine tRNA methylthiotransferase MtaB|nr:tRNA (N(6)-L-threonylcarbamoyladenosine(37)-C(2))-methylthiotransferase MtaB [Coriobacteriales bacterium]